MYARADRFVQRLQNEQDYTRDEKQRRWLLTEEGVCARRSFLWRGELTDAANNGCTTTSCRR
jgi:preprotein translocase subunit SecA